MRIHSIIVDDFFMLPKGLRQAAIDEGFGAVVSPKDGVSYPGIQMANSNMKSIVEAKLLTLFPGKRVKLNNTFFRLSTLGEVAPHQAHTDKIMGQYTLIVYLSDPSPGVFCGTTVLEHASGTMATHPESPEGEALWTKDTNNPEAWVTVGQCSQKFNRGFVLRSDLFHRSEPVGGFGKDSDTGRLVLVSFFDLT